MLSIVLGLAAALAWGCGDFTGGWISRRISPVWTTLFVQAAGILPLLGLAALAREASLSRQAWAWSLGAGAVGALGLYALYRALAEGQMSIAAPVTALISAALPVVAGAWLEGLPDRATLAGFGLALVAIWNISYSGGNQTAANFRIAGLRWPVLAGTGLGLFLILLAQGSQSGVFLPLAAARGAGSVVLLGLAALRREGLPAPGRMLPWLALNTAFDVGGSLFYILAAQAGRLDLAAVLGSLYSGATVLLAWLVLRERISRRQAFGVALALGGILLITWGSVR